MKDKLCNRHLLLNLNRHLLVIILCLLSIVSNADTKMNPKDYAAEVPNLSKDVGFSTTDLSIGVLAFGALVLILVTIPIIRKNQGWGNNSIKIFALALITFSCLFLITAGYSSDQITPVIGLFGAIIGYLLGKNDNGASPANTGTP